MQAQIWRKTESKARLPRLPSFFPLTGLAVGEDTALLLG